MRNLVCVCQQGFLILLVNQHVNTVLLTLRNSCLVVEEEANSVKLQEEMMYQRSEHAVSIETLKADHENLLEETSSELKRKHEGEIQLGKVSIINPLTPRSDQGRISPYNINTISSIEVLRIK